MSVYDPVLVGWGVDLWFMEVLAPDIEGKVAVVDEISCINPFDETKGNQREIDLLQKTPDRIKNWKKIKEKYKLKNDLGGFIEYGSILDNPLHREDIDSEVNFQYNNHTILCNPEIIFKRVIYPKNEEIQDLKKSEKQQQVLMDLIRETTKLSLMRHPIKKYKAYKSMLKAYFNIRRIKK